MPSLHAHACDIFKAVVSEIDPAHPGAFVMCPDWSRFDLMIRLISPPSPAHNLLGSEEVEYAGNLGL